MTLRAAHLICFTLMISTIAPAAPSEEVSPVGVWKSTSDDNGTPRALIRIVDRNGKLEGRVEQVFPEPEEDQNPRCEKCEGEHKDAPVVGLVIMTGLVKVGDEYVNGKILDPETGNVYKSKVRVWDAGRKLSVRGYMGTPLLGRTQIWIRVE